MKTGLFFCIPPLRLLQFVLRQVCSRFLRRLTGIRVIGNFLFLVRSVRSSLHYDATRFIDQAALILDSPPFPSPLQFFSLFNNKIEQRLRPPSPLSSVINFSETGEGGGEISKKSSALEDGCFSKVQGKTFGPR